MSTIIGTDENGFVKYINQPNVNRRLFKNIKEGVPEQELDEIKESITALENSPKILEYGRTNSSLSIPANGYLDYPITFTKEYSSAPYVFLTLNGSVDSGIRGSVSAFTTTTTKTESNARIYNNTSSTLSVNLYWVAIL